MFKDTLTQVSSLTVETLKFLGKYHSIHILNLNTLLLLFQKNLKVERR